MPSTIILGATSPLSLGRQFIPMITTMGHTPIVIGRSAMQYQDDLQLQGCRTISADLTDTAVANTILTAIGDLSDIRQIIVAGGGPHYKGLLSEEDPGTSDTIWRSIVHGPIRLIQAFHALTSLPYHLVTIASTSALRIRADETTYATAQAARAIFAQNFHAELMARTGSQNTIFYPGGMKTGLWDSATNTEGFMDPKVVANIMWSYITRTEQTTGICEVVIDRPKDGSNIPVVTHK